MHERDHRKIAQYAGAFSIESRLAVPVMLRQTNGSGEGKDNVLRWCLVVQVFVSMFASLISDHYLVPANRRHYFVRNDGIPVGIEYVFVSFSAYTSINSSY